MTKRIIAIAFIFLCTSVCWGILGGTVFSRTYDSSATSSSRVASTWGIEQKQSPPTASFKTKVQKQEEVLENSKKVIRIKEEEYETPLALEQSAVDVKLDLEHRQKGLLWYSTYKVDFSGNYTFHNPSDKEQLVDFKLQFPTTQAIYDNLVFTVDGSPTVISNENNVAMTSIKIGGGKSAQLAVGYRSQGLNQWRYSLGTSEVSQVRGFTLHMTTNFKDMDFRNTPLPPTTK